MLSEFAFTPAVFDEAAHPDKEAWQDQLRELRAAMFPRTSAWPVIVSDLFNGAWFSHIQSYVENIHDHRCKKACRDLLTGIQQSLVVRPECRDWPHEEDTEWCREAIATSEIEPVDRIITVDATKQSSASEFRFVRLLQEVTDSGFWRGIRSTASPKMLFAEQVDLVRKLCLHSQWVALINPYGFSTEIEFSIELLKMTLNRPHAFGRIHIELHSSEPQVNDPEEKSRRIESITRDMNRRISPLVTKNSSVELYFWPKSLERTLIAGQFTTVSGGKARKAARWGVKIGHVARYDDHDAEPSDWGLLEKERLTQRFSKYVDDKAPNKPQAISVSQNCLRDFH